MGGETNWSCQTCSKKPFWKKGNTVIKQLHSHPGNYQKACPVAHSCITSEYYQIEPNQKVNLKVSAGWMFDEAINYNYYSVLIV